MDASKDYYAILGVLPSIEPTALKAVYLALLKKYHPDVYNGNVADAERITKELNEAFGVLGDQSKRAEYDGLRKEKSSGGDFSQENTTDGVKNVDSEFEKDWKFVVEYYPEAENQRLILEKITPSLAFMFQIQIITNKLAKNSIRVSNYMQQEYLNRYFGKNKKLHNFVIQLLNSNRKDAALEINNYIRIVGDDSDKELDKLIKNIKRKFNINIDYDYSVIDNYYESPNSAGVIILILFLLTIFMMAVVK